MRQEEEGRLPERVRSDRRVIMTLDAGGTKLVFSAMRGGNDLVDPISRPSHPDDLTAMLRVIAEGFTEVADALDAPPSAISFAFPGPSFYKLGIIGDLPNLPAFRGGVPLGPYLEERFGVPVFINNDGNLFTLGESVAGLLPDVNAALSGAGSGKRFENLVGVTLGTGFGAGVVVGGRLITGDNDVGGEIWVMRNHLLPDYCVEAYVGKRYLQRLFAENAQVPFDEAPETRVIFEIAQDDGHRHGRAALDAFASMGRAAGDAIAHAVTMIDGLVVVGGGLAGAARFVLPPMLEVLRSRLHHFTGEDVPHVLSRCLNLEDPTDWAEFLRGDRRTVTVPDSNRTVEFDAMSRIGVGLSRLGTSRAVSLGAFLYALDALDRVR